MQGDLLTRRLSGYIMATRLPTALVCLALVAPAARAQLPAFPGAEGFGAAASGGRRGDVYHVTHLGDAGPGSLRDAVSRGPRVVVFDVGGYVELKSTLRVASDITLAGQSAPGDGIGVKNYEVSFSGAHNVIVRFVRFRLGETAEQDTRSAVVLAGSRDVILDHCSIQFGRWDNLQLIGGRNITIQHSIIGPALGRQLGCLCAAEDVTFHHNLLIGNAGRSVKTRGKVQFVNNVVYNWRQGAFADAGLPRGPSWSDLVGNYFIAGPDTGPAPPVSAAATAHVYTRGNLIDGDRDGKLNGTPLKDTDLGPATVETSPFAAPPIAVTVESADVAYDKVVAGVGCSLRRDAVDTRLIADLKSLGKKGRLISAPGDVGGPGQLRGGPAPKDTDGDGIPDDWELSHNLDPTRYSDRNTLDKSGYTMVEVYLNSLADQTTVPGTNTFTLKVDPAAVQARPGAKTKITVTATRRGYDGPISLEVRNLPAGVTAAKATIPQGQTTTDVYLATAKGTTGNRGDVQVRGTQSDGKTAVNSPNFSVQVQGTPNFTLTLAPGALKLKAGTKATVQVTANRKDYQGAINVQLHGLPTHLKAAAATILAGQNMVSIDITADAKANQSGSVFARGTAGSYHFDTPAINVTVHKK